MTREEALEVISKALKAVVPDYEEAITFETDLVGEDIIDSLDSMNLLFELEEGLGKKLTEIDEDYNDYNVGSLVDVILRS